MTDFLSPQERLTLAIESLDHHRVQEALAAGADPNQPDAHDCLPVMAVFQQAPPAHEIEMREQGLPIHTLAFNRVLDTLFAHGARGDASWSREGQEPALGVFWQISLELQTFGIDLRNQDDTADNNAIEALGRVRRWYDHGADPLAPCSVLRSTSEDQEKSQVQDVVDWLEWNAYCWGNDDNLQVLPQLKLFIHEILVVLLEKGLPAEKLLGDSNHHRCEHLDDMGPGLHVAINKVEAWRRSGKSKDLLPIEKRNNRPRHRS